MKRKSLLKPVKAEDLGFDETGKPLDLNKV